MRSKGKLFHRTLQLILCMVLLFTFLPQKANAAEKVEYETNMKFVVGADGDFGDWLDEQLRTFPRVYRQFGSVQTTVETYWKKEGGSYQLLDGTDFSNATAGSYYKWNKYIISLTGQQCGALTARINVSWVNRIEFKYTGMFEGSFGVKVESGENTVTTYELGYDTTSKVLFTPVVPNGYCVKNVTVDDANLVVNKSGNNNSNVWALTSKDGRNITVSPTITVEYAVVEGGTISAPAAPGLAGGDTDKMEESFTLPADLRLADTLEITATGGVDNSINKTQKYENITAGSVVSMTLDDEVVRGPVTYNFKYSSSKVNYSSTPTRSRTYYQILAQPVLSQTEFEYTGSPIYPADKLTGVRKGTYTLWYGSMVSGLIGPVNGGDFTKLTTDNDIWHQFIVGLGSPVCYQDCPYVIEVRGDESKYYKGSYSLQYTVIPRALTVKAKSQEVAYGSKAQSGRNHVEVTAGSLLSGHSITAATITESGNELTVKDGSVTIQDASGVDANKYYTINYAAGTKVTVPATPDLGTVSQTGIIYDSSQLSDVKLKMQKTTIPGTLVLVDGQALQTGTNSYNWLFTPEDTVNYKTVTGTVSLNVTKDQVEELQVRGELTQSEYTHGDTFHLDGITVTAMFTSGRTKDVTSQINFDEKLSLGQTSVVLSYKEEGSEERCCEVAVTVDKKKLLIVGAYVEDRAYDTTKAVDIQAVFLDGVVGNDDVSVDMTVLKGELESSMYNYSYYNADAELITHFPDGYQRVKLTDAVLSGADKDNYILAQSTDADGYVLLAEADGSDGAMFITPRRLTITLLDQTIVEGKKLNQKRYQVEGLIPGHVLKNVNLVALKDGQVLDPDTEFVDGLEAEITILDLYGMNGIEVGEEGTDFVYTSYYDITANGTTLHSATLKVVAGCEKHDFENGFCKICDTYEEPELVDGYYQLENAGNLFWFAKVVNEGYLPTNTDKDNTINAKLTADIEIPEYNNDGERRVWIPIGFNEEWAYLGTFDGDFHTISGLYNSGSEMYLGLVGCGDESTLKNVGVVDSYFRSSAQNAYVGGIAGCNYGTVSCCWFAGTVETDYLEISLGGVVGHNGSINGVVENCYNAGTVKSNYDGIEVVRVGGVVGRNLAGTVRYCHNAGSVSSAGTGGANNNAVGEIIGNNKGFSGYVSYAQNCYGKVDTAIGYPISHTSSTYSSVDEVGSYRDMEGGEVAYLLNDSSPTGIWGQRIGTDLYPVLQGPAVYEVNDCLGCACYSNEQEPNPLDHDLREDGTCYVCQEKIICYVTFHGTNVSLEGETSVKTGEDYVATLTIAEGYELAKAVTVTIGENVFENFTYDTTDGKLTIPAEAVTEDIVIEAESKLHVHQPGENNQCSCGLKYVALILGGEDTEPQYFSSLTQALDAVKDSTSEETIVKLLHSVDLGGKYLTINSGVFCLDLNGQSLSSTADKVIYINGSNVNLTILDNGTDGKIEKSGILMNNGLLEVNSGCVSAIVNQGGEVQINDGTIGTLVSKYGHITILGGSITGEDSALHVEGGTVSVIGGNISGNGVHAIDGEISITGGNIQGDSTDVYCDGASVTFELDEKGEGVIFPGGISIDGTGDYDNLNGYLAENASYWIGTTQKSSVGKAIADGDVAVKEKVTYAVNCTGTGVKFADNKVAYKDCNYEISMIAQEGYQLPENITVKIGDIVVTEYTYDNDKVTIPGELVSGNIDIYVTGVRKTYTISVTDEAGNANTSVSLSEQEAVHGKECQVILNNAVGSDIILESVKSGENDISEEVVFDEASHVLTIPADWVTDNIVITADATVMITINGNGGTCTSAYFEGNTEVSFTNKYGKTYTAEQLLFERSGYTCVGINTKADGKGTDYDLNMELTATEDINLFVQWKKETHKLTWILDGVEQEPVDVVCDGEITLPEASETKKEGYSFAQWTGDEDTVPETMPHEDISIRLKSEWKVNSYKINYYNSKDASEPLVSTEIGYGEDITGEMFTPADVPGFLPDGCEFLYWTLKDSEEAYELPEKMPASNLNLYAKVKIELPNKDENNKVTYTLTYKLDGGTNNSKNPSTYHVNTPSFSLKAPTKKGYTFNGWYSDAKGTKKITQITKGSTGNKTLYAKWVPIKYTIKFNGNGATSGKMTNLSNRKYNTSYTLTLNAYKRKGYTFTGWNTKADGKGKSYKNKAGVKNLTTVDGKTVTLYAQWKKDTYKITYKLNGGKNNKSNPSSYTVTKAKITLKKATRTGYTFAGWYSDSKFKKKVTTIAKGSTGNKTLYAKWNPIKYTIKFNGNGATSGKMSSLTNRKYGKNYQLTANAYKKTGYKFAGWNTKKNGNGKKYKNKASVKNLVSQNGKTITLYAQWKKK